MGWTSRTGWVLPLRRALRALLGPPGCPRWIAFTAQIGPQGSGPGEAQGEQGFADPGGSVDDPKMTGVTTSSEAVEIAVAGWNSQRGHRLHAECDVRRLWVRLSRGSSRHLPRLELSEPPHGFFGVVLGDAPVSVVGQPRREVRKRKNVNSIAD